MGKGYKKYKSSTGVEYNFYVVVDGKEQFISLNGPGSILIVRNAKLARAIENSNHFKSKRIVLVSVVGDPELKDDEVKESMEVDEYPSVKNVGDAVEVLTTIYGVPESDIARKAQAQAKAEELGVKFPNWR